MVNVSCDPARNSPVRIKQLQPGWHALAGTSPLKPSEAVPAVKPHRVLPVQRPGIGNSVCPRTPQYVPLPTHGKQDALLRLRAEERPNHPARRATDRKGRAMRRHEVSRCLGGIGSVTQRQQRHRGPWLVGAQLSRVRAPGEIADLRQIDVVPTELTAESIADSQCRGAPIATAWGYRHLS